jgi:hypothetical protein
LIKDNQYHTEIGHTVLWLSFAARIGHTVLRLSHAVRIGHTVQLSLCPRINRCCQAFTHILGSARVQKIHQLPSPRADVNNHESKKQCPSNSLHRNKITTHSFNFLLHRSLLHTVASPKLLPLATKAPNFLQCNLHKTAQQMHFSPVNKMVCPLECAALTSQVSSASPNTILYPHFGQGMGTKRASHWYSTRTQLFHLVHQPHQQSKFYSLVHYCTHTLPFYFLQYQSLFSLYRFYSLIMQQWLLPSIRWHPHCSMPPTLICSLQ